MRIIEQKSIHALRDMQGNKGAGAANQARFVLNFDVATMRPEARMPISLLGNIDALIAIKAEDNAKDRRRRSFKRGQALLDVLDELKIALLSGHLPPNLEDRLTFALHEIGSSGDPKLDPIIEAIELRAEVELAKIKNRKRGV